MGESVMNPATALVEHLAAARRRGESFDAAWPDALTGALAVVQTAWERNEWAGVLSGMASTWREAYLRVPAGRHERALAAVAQDRDREPLPDRECERCGEEIPPERGPLAIYCSGDCKDETNRENERAARAAA
jgi:predicted nucleic acid-binding Zn ribbon protein